LSSISTLGPIGKAIGGETKTAACRRAAAQADSPERAEYLRLQCDSRQTRERIQYLRDYSVQ